MPKFRDLTGTKFGRLTVIELAGHTGKARKISWLCQCDCGNRKVVLSNSLTSQRTFSCGCLHDELLVKRNTIHGKVGSRVYSIWQNMNRRCYEETNPAYSRYGGRGIKVCNRWHIFENFYSDMGDPPPGTSLDRIDNDGDYKPTNCRWATIKEQNNNSRRNRLVKYRGQIFTFAQLAEKYFINPRTLRGRLRAGWSLEKAITTPVRKT